MNIKTSLSEFISDEKVKAGIWYCLLNSVFVLLISTKYFFLLFSGVASVHPVYSVMACVSHFFALCMLPFLLIFLPIYSLLKNYRLAKWVSIVMSVLSLIVLTIDAYVFSLYRFHLNIYVLEQVFGPASGQVFEFSIGQYIMVALFLLLLLGIEYVLFNLAERCARRFIAGKIFWLFPLWGILLLSVQSYRTWGLFHKDRSILAVENHFPLVVPFYPNECFPSYSMMNHLKGEGRTYSYPKKEIITHAADKNLLIVGFDAWRYDTMDSICSPNIYRFAKKAVVYKNHYSCSNSTKSGVFSIFYGLSGVYFNDFNQQSISPVLMQEFFRQKYDVRLFPSASLRNPPLDKTVFQMVSDQCDPTEGMNAWQRDQRLATNYIHYLAERDTTNPFFSFLFFDSLHSMIEPDDYKGPFQPSWSIAHYERLGNDTDPVEFFNLYKNMVYYLDSLVGCVLNELEQRGLLENTIVVFTGDHAQEFNDNHHGFWGHNGNYSDAQIRVPMIYYHPEVTPAVYDHWTAHYDLVPTLMRDLFGAENAPSDYSMGTYLDDKKDRNYLLVDTYIGAGVIDSTKNILNLLYSGECQLTDAGLNEDFSSPIDSSLVEKMNNQLQMFYK